MNENFSERTKTGKGIPRLVKRIGLFVIITFLPALLFICAFILPVLPRPDWLSSHVSQLFGILFTLAGFFWPGIFIAYICLTIAFCFGAILRRWPTLTSAAIYIPFLVSGLALQVYILEPVFQIRMSKLALIAMRARPLIDALEKYKKEHAQYPATLSELTPRYISHIPDAQDLANSSFIYKKADLKAASGSRGKRLAEIQPEYELRINITVGMRFEFMSYWPGGNYPKKPSQEVVEKIDGWAIFRDD